MVTLQGNLSEVYRALPGTVPVARKDVADFAARAGVSGRQLDAIRLAVSEALTNVVVHAYRAEPGQIHVTAAVASDELWVLVADDGCGHQTPATSPGLGWGLALMAESSDSFEIAERAGGGTEVRLRFAIAG